MFAYIHTESVLLISPNMKMTPTQSLNKEEQTTETEGFSTQHLTNPNTSKV